MSQESVVIDGEGGTWTAEFPDLAITTAYRDYSLTATATLPDGSTLTRVSAPFDVTARPPARLHFSSEPASTRAAHVIEPPVAVQVQDQFGNPVSSSSSVPVTLTLAGGPAGAALEGTTTVATKDGIAEFDSLRIDVPGGNYQLQADAPRLRSTTSAAFQVLQASSAGLAFQTVPTAVVAGSVIDPAVIVIETDHTGQPIYDSGTTIALSLEADNGARLSGPTTAVTVQGRATFDRLVIDRPGGGYRLTASAAGLASVSTNQFDVRPTGVPAPAGSVAWWPFVAAAGALALLGLVVGLLRGREAYRRPPPGPPPRAEPHPDAGTVDLVPAAGPGTARTVDIRIEPHSDAGSPHLGTQP